MISNFFHILLYHSWDGAVMWASFGVKVRQVPKLLCSSLSIPVTVHPLQGYVEVERDEKLEIFHIITAHINCTISVAKDVLKQPVIQTTLRRYPLDLICSFENINTLTFCDMYHILCNSSYYKASLKNLIKGTLFI